MKAIMYQSSMIRKAGVGVLILYSLFGAHFTQASFSQSDLNNNDISDHTEGSVTVTGNVFLDAGEYQFQNLIVSPGATLTLKGDPDSSSSFKGVKITADNITIEEGGFISANGQGYLAGPGASSEMNVGASHGGVGGDNVSGTTYGSSLMPLDLGSGVINSYRGGGAIWLEVGGVLENDGVISADGVVYSSSGGSVYIVTHNLTGSGDIRANGGDIGWPYRFTGGGGRVAVYYESSSFDGKVEARGGNYCFYGCAPNAESGTAGLFDVSSDTLTVASHWRFQASEQPFNFNHLVFKNGAKITSESGVSVTAQDMLVDSSSFTLAEDQILNIPEVTFDDYSTLKLSENQNLNINHLNVSNHSSITVDVEKILSLKVANLSIDQTSTVSVDGKGYQEGPGTPPVPYEGGASYGGRGGGNSAPTYGSANEPTDFGSGTEGHRGGGAIRLEISGTLHNDGFISALGSDQRTSGGSIYVTAGNLAGSGAFRADGASTGWPYGSAGAGAGGRIALYFNNPDYIPTATAKGGTYCFYGCAPAAEDGTIVINSSDSVCLVDCYSNILFLPGLMGSRLFSLDDDELWVSMLDSNHARLALSDTGDSAYTNIHTKNDTQHDGELDETGIVDDIFSANIYQSFIKELQDWKEDDQIIEDYAFIPYDWRLSLEDIVTNGRVDGDNLYYDTPQDFSESFILQKLQELQTSSRTGKVTIIAHSHGGLVAKALIKKLEDTNNPLFSQIDKVIFIAVPQVGTPDSIPALLHGTELVGGLLMDKDRSRQLSENMPTIYNLLPSSGYFTTVDPAFAVDKVVSFENDPLFLPQTSQYGVFVSNETELENYILGTDGRTKPAFSDTLNPNIGNSVLYNQAQAVHQGLDSWQPHPDTKVIQVAGWGEETVAGLSYKKYLKPNGTASISYKPNFVIDGDGTVVVPSALWMSESNPNVERWWVDLEKEGGLLAKNRIHRDILEVSNLRDFIKSIILNETFFDPDNIVLDDDSNLTSSSTRLHYTLHSPLTLGVEDSEGRYTGQDPITKEIKEEIPGVVYKQIGEVQFISVPSEMEHIVRLKGYENGSFSLDVDKKEGNEIVEFTSFQGIPSTTNTVATMEVDSGSGVLDTPLKVDQNGDGAVDFNLVPKLGNVVTVPYKFSGFSQPINDLTFYPSQAPSVFKAGSTVPVKFQLKKYDGTVTQATSLPLWLTPQKGSAMSAAVAESVYSLAGTSGNTYRWDATSQQYIYNWSTKGLAPGFWYRIYAKLDDGNTYSVTVGLR